MAHSEIFSKSLTLISQVYKLFLKNSLNTEDFDLFGIWICLTDDLKSYNYKIWLFIETDVHMVHLLKLNKKCLRLTSVLKAFITAGLPEIILYFPCFY